MGSGFKTFTAGSVLTASDVNNFLMEQSIMVFATTAARDAAITAPEAGMVAYINTSDVNRGFYIYNGTAWQRGGGWNMPWGLMPATSGGTNGMAYRTGLSVDYNTGNTMTAVTNGSITVSVVANRLYKATFIAPTLSTDGSGNAIIDIDDGAGTSRMAAENWIDIGKPQSSTINLFVTFASSGSQTFRARTGRATGFVNRLVASSMAITVEDIGPATTP